MKLNKSTFSVLLLLILYAVGFYGSTHSINWIKNATPVHLIICVLLFLWNEPKRWTLQQAMVAAGVFIFGVLIEWLGVKTGFPFGNYHYGKILGWQIDGIPLTMGLNWLLLALLSATISGVLLPNKPILLRSLLGSALMLLTDLPMERICAKLDFWYWQEGSAPLQNYIAWFVLGMGVQYLVHFAFKDGLKNRVALVLYLLQFLFFAGLVFFLKT